MSKPRYHWYGIVLKVIRSYPMLSLTKSAKQTQSVTASYSGMPHSGNVSRTTENVALRQLSPREETDYEAVYRAIEDIGRQKDGKEVLEVVEMYHWKGVRNFETVGDLTHMSCSVAKSRNKRFVYQVAKNLQYM